MLRQNNGSHGMGLSKSGGTANLEFVPGCLIKAFRVFVL